MFRFGMGVFGIFALSFSAAANTAHLSLRSLAPASVRLEPVGSESNAELMLREKSAPARAPEATGLRIFSGVDCRDSESRPIDPSDAAYVGCERNAVELQSRPYVPVVPGTTPAPIPLLTSLPGMR
jgi:hypothetical protein